MENELSFMSLFLTSDCAWFANVIKLKKKTPTFEGNELTDRCYAASRRFSLAWLLAFTKSFVWLVCGVVGLFTPREKSLKQSHANDFVNANSHVRKKPSLAG